METIKVYERPFPHEKHLDTISLFYFDGNWYGCIDYCFVEMTKQKVEIINVMSDYIGASIRDFETWKQRELTIPTIRKKIRDSNKAFNVPPCIRG